jgi:tetraacyldisaccharide-1-P 4'-kinase
MFADHYRYTANDLRELGQMARQHRADCLLTTEKDLVNLPDEISCSAPVY